MKTCDICYQIKPVRDKNNDKLDSLDTLHDPFNDLIMDFITDLPLFEYHQVVYDSVFLFIYQYTKMAKNIAARID